MQLAVNQLLKWTVNNSNITERILWMDKDVICVISVENNDSPYFRNICEIKDAMANNTARTADRDDYIIVVNEEDIPEKYKKMRDNAWNVIKNLVEKEPEIFKPAYRRKAMHQVAEKYNISESSVFRYLKKYWKRGKTINALLPDYAFCGGKGKEKSTGSFKIGRPRKHEDKTDQGINVTEDIKKIFRIAINRFYYTTAKNSLKLAYELMIKEYFVKDYKIENGIRIPIIKSQSEIPSFNQFRYYWQKENNIQKQITCRYSNKKFQKQFRAITGSSMDGVLQPGTYEIDCQVADVYLVSRFNRNWIIGRPAIYACIDRFSRAVTGIYIGLESGSFLGAAMAIANSASDKVDFCRQYGIQIKEEDWPIKYIPECIVADRGELIGKDIENIVNGLGIRVQNTPGYRADLKPIIERFFGLTNQRVKPFIPGVVNLDGRERGDKDYRLEGKLDLYQFTQIIIKCILFHNNYYRLKNYNREEMMIEDEVPCIPIQLWNWGIANRGGTLRTVTEDIVKLLLMPTANVTVTPKGIKFKNMYYVSKSMLKDQSFVKARVNGTWRMKASYDPRNLNFIYLHKESPNEYEKCLLVESQSRYRDKTLEEINYLVEIEKMQEKKSNDSVAQVKTQLITEIENIVKQANDDYTKEPEGIESDRQRVKNIRSNRLIEKTANRVEEAFELSKNIDLKQKSSDEKTYKETEYDDLELLISKQKEALSGSNEQDNNS